ncbi:hypothetical protein RDABS01_036375 [Bienertia sinuspersici]
MGGDSGGDSAVHSVLAPDHRQDSPVASPKWPGFFWSKGNSENTTRLIADSMNVNSGTGIGNPDDVNCNMDQNKLTAAGTNNCNRCNDNDAVNGGVNGDKGMEEAGNETHVDAPVKIDLDDIDEELVYWSSAMVVYVLGANPPFSVFNGYCHRIWGKKGLDKVLLVGKGLYLVRFNSVEQREKIWNDEPKFFDSKPVIMKRWDPDMELHKETIKTVPIWTRFPKLELKYWGHRSIHKLGDAIGTTLKVDRLTEQKERLAYARIMVEVDIQKELPDQIEFINEKGISMVQLIEYEWRPNFCSKCNKYGHRGEECSKGVRKEIAWKPKKPSGPPSDQQQGCPRITNPGQQQTQTGQNPDRMGQQQKKDRMGQQQPPQHMLQGPMSDETEGVAKGSCRPLLQTRSSAEQQRPNTTQQQQLTRANNGADVHGQAQSQTAIQTKVSTGNVQGVDIGDIGEFTPDPILAIMEKQATETFRGATKSYNSWLKQKAKIHWLQDGDTNSKIFFNSLRVRTCRNNINRVQNTHGIWVEDHDSITRAFTDFYTDLLQGSDHNRRLVIKDIVRMGSTLNDDHRSMLDCTFSDKEIKQAIFSIPSNKAPSLDGYNSCFFKEAWSVVGQDVIRAGWTATLFRESKPSLVSAWGGYLLPTGGSQ